MRDGSAGPTTSTRNRLRREEAGRGACPPPAKTLLNKAIGSARDFIRARQDLGYAREIES
jgi:hypothetical protein